MTCHSSATPQNQQPGYQPEGLRFTDDRGKPYLLITKGPYEGWLCYQGAEGQWVTLRKATGLEKLVAKVTGEKMGHRQVLGIPRYHPRQP